MKNLTINQYAPLTTIDTSILTFPWESYQEIKDLDTENSKREAFFHAFKSRSLYSKILGNLSKIPLEECVLEDGTPILQENGVSTKAFMQFFTEEVYGRFPGVDMTSAAILTFMAIIANEPRSAYVVGSQSKNPETSAAVPPILAAFKEKIPYSGWNLSTKSAPFFLGKDLASAWIKKDQLNAACDELHAIAIENKMDVDAMMSILTPSKFRSWDPKMIPSTYQKPKKNILATNYNGLEAFEKSMLLNLWMFKHDEPLMIVNVNDFDSRERMWRGFNEKGTIDAETDGIFGLLSKIKNPHISQELTDIFNEPRKLLKTKTTTKVQQKEEDVPW